MGGDRRDGRTDSSVRKPVSGQNFFSTDPINIWLIGFVFNNSPIKQIQFRLLLLSTRLRLLCSRVCTGRHVVSYLSARCCCLLGAPPSVAREGLLPGGRRAGPRGYSGSPPNPDWARVRTHQIFSEQLQFHRRCICAACTAQSRRYSFLTPHEDAASDPSDPNDRPDVSLLRSLLRVLRRPTLDTPICLDVIDYPLLGCEARGNREEVERRAASEDVGGGGGGGEPEERLSRIWYEASSALALPAAAVKGANELPQADTDAKEAAAVAALEERAASYEKLASRAGSADSKWLKLAGPGAHFHCRPRRVVVTHVEPTLVSCATRHPMTRRACPPGPARW